METALEFLGKSIARCTDKGELHTTAVPGLSLFRRDEPTETMSGMYEPSICLVAQGGLNVCCSSVPDCVGRESGESDSPGDRLVEG